MVSGKSKKNVVIFNSLMWATVGGMGIGLFIVPVILGQAELDITGIFFVLPCLALIFAAGRGLHFWWGK